MDPITLKDNERIDFLEREGIQIIQSPSFFTLSLDAILLADFIELPKKAFRYIDFCSGNGVIPLLLTARTDNVLEGVEIQPELVDMAKRSAALNQLSDRIIFHTMDLNDFKRPPYLYDVISCNPPYFLVENSEAVHQLSPHAMARHELTLTMSDWVKKARSLLKTRGKLYIVHRPERLDDLFMTLLSEQFAVNRLRFVHPRQDRRANTVLVEAIYQGGRQGVKVEPALIVYDDAGNYTDAMEAIYYGDRHE